MQPEPCFSSPLCPTGSTWVPSFLQTTCVSHWLPQSLQQFEAGDEASRSPLTQTSQQCPNLTRWTSSERSQGFPKIFYKESETVKKFKSMLMVWLPIGPVECFNLIPNRSKAYGYTINLFFASFKPSNVLNQSTRISFLLSNLTFESLKI